MKQGNQWKSVDLDVNSIASPHRNPGEEYLFYRAVAAGQIGTGNTANVTYTNTIMPKLPSTGGPGAFRFTFGGITLIALASVMVITGRRRDEHTTA